MKRQKCNNNCFMSDKKEIMVGYAEGVNLEVYFTRPGNLCEISSRLKQDIQYSAYKLRSQYTIDKVMEFFELNTDE